MSVIDTILTVFASFTVFVGQMSEVQYKPNYLTATLGILSI